MACYSILFISYVLQTYCAWTTHVDVIMVGFFIPQVNLPDFDCDIVFPTVMEPGER